MSGSSSWLCLTMSILLALCDWANTYVFAQSAYVYPKARRSDQVKTFHGQAVSDPYQWLEELSSQETLAWIEAQRQFSTLYFDKLPQYNAVKKRLSELIDSDIALLPTRQGTSYFFEQVNAHTGNPTLTYSLYVADTLTAPPRLLIDPTKIDSGIQINRLASFAPSNDGQLVAYLIPTKQGPITHLRILNVKTGRDTTDELRDVAVQPIAWTQDARGFFYSRFDAANAAPADSHLVSIYYHQVGTDQSLDRCIFKSAVSGTAAAQVSADGRYLLLTHQSPPTPAPNPFISYQWPTFPQGEAGMWIGYVDLKQPSGKVTELIKDGDAKYRFLGCHGDTFWFFTNLRAPKGRIIALNRNVPDQANWVNLIPETDASIADVVMAGHHFAIVYDKEAHSRLKLYNRKGKFVKEIALPLIGQITRLAGQPQHPELLYQFGTYVHRPTVEAYNVITGKKTAFQPRRLSYEPSVYLTKQVFYMSPDGTRVPMFITHKKNRKPGTVTPTLLYVYGAFGWNELPYYHQYRTTWLELGGVLAIANVRGGGEYGLAWHEAVRGANRYKSIDDTIAAAEWLIANQYTTAAHLGLHGLSAGGAITSGVVNKRPDLFGAFVVEVANLDLLYRAPSVWEYGTLQDKEGFRNILSLSPYHNVRTGTCYPPTLITLTDEDSNAVACYKFGAALQNAQGCSKPMIVRIGHNETHLPRGKLGALRHADTVAFLYHNLGLNEMHQNGSAYESKRDRRGAREK